MQVFDLEAQGLRALNASLHAQRDTTNQTAWEVVNPRGSHAIAVGLDAPIEVTVKGSTGYYCAGMNKQATVHVEGSVGPGVAENMMSGTVVIEGDASAVIACRALHRDLNRRIESHGNRMAAARIDHLPGGL
ncbi:MAG: hypothetical protein AAF700_03720, partial [Pseudomonadota bacterium]